MFLISPSAFLKTEVKIEMEKMKPITSSSKSTENETSTGDSFTIARQH